MVSINQKAVALGLSCQLLSRPAKLSFGPESVAKLIEDLE
jgi:hypothetical protein